MHITLFALFACLLFVSFAQAGGVGRKLKPEISAERVLFLGNSITRHGPKADIGWTSDWGMAASSIEKDYVHLVASGLGDLAGKKPEIQFTNIADFERETAKFDLEGKLKANLEFKPTLVVVALGENVPGLKTDEAKAQFKADFAKLLTMLKSNGGPTLVVRSSFWPDKLKDEIMRDACTAAGGIFVDISALSKDESNYGRSEKKWEHEGVGAHPGDKGMRAIADAIVAGVSR